jgi:L-aminopeptidase/D-esterase-like protein
VTTSASATPVDLTRFGIVVGHATDDAGATGLTVVRASSGAIRAGVAVFGRATGSRELHAASADHLVEGRVDAILLTGGSAYGLDAAAGVMRWMEERGRGFAVGGGVVPIVPAAVIFDLAPLGRFAARPSTDMAYDACDTATARPAEGCIGVGTGATVGKLAGPSSAMKTGFGCAVAESGDRTVGVAAMVVVNAFGDVRDGRGAIVAGARDERGGFADTAATLARADVSSSAHASQRAMRNTTLAVVAASEPLSATELTQLARAAGAALFKRITPAGTTFDGDIIFAISPEHGDGARHQPIVIEALAVAALEAAIERSATLARGRDGTPGYTDIHEH